MGACGHRSRILNVAISRAAVRRPRSQDRGRTCRSGSRHRYQFARAGGQEVYRQTALAILAEARRAARKEPTGDSFVFFGVIPKRPLSNMALSMLLRRLNIDVTVHGFRTSFRTWASEIGHVEFELAESCLSHRVGNAVSRAYNRSNLLERRRPIMAAWASYVGGQR